MGEVLRLGAGGVAAAIAGRPSAGHAGAPAGLRGPPGRNDEAFQLLAAALGGLLLACSAVREGYTRRIRSLEDEIVRLSDLAERDHLTGLANRRSFERRFACEWHRALRHGSHLTLALVDVDLFKLFNDMHGHPAGDDALRGVAGCLAGALGRAADCAFRVGGEEFALLLPDTDLRGAILVAERVRDALRVAALPHGRSPTGAVTVSIGSCSTIARDGDEAAALLPIADRALYEAKRAGRDRAVCVRRPPPRPTGCARADAGDAPHETAHRSA